MSRIWSWIDEPTEDELLEIKDSLDYDELLSEVEHNDYLYQLTKNDLDKRVMGAFLDNHYRDLDDYICMFTENANGHRIVLVADRSNGGVEACAHSMEAAIRALYDNARDCEITELYDDAIVFRFGNSGVKYKIYTITDEGEEACEKAYEEAYSLPEDVLLKDKRYLEKLSI